MVTSRVLARLATTGAIGLVVPLALPGTALAVGVTCGSTITAPGTYTLTANCSGGEIHIAANNVTLRLSGHTMTSDGSDPVGIVAYEQSYVRILGPGTVSGFSFTDVFLLGVDHSLVQSLTVDHAALGIYLSSSMTRRSDLDTVAGNTVHTVISAGIAIDGADHSRIVSNTATGSSDYGISMDSGIGNVVQSNRVSGAGTGIGLTNGATGNTLTANTVSASSNVDLEDGNGNCTANRWRGNRFTTANPSCLR